MIDGMSNFSLYVIVILVTICIGSLLLLVMVVNRNKYYLDQLKDKSIDTDTTRRRITIDKLKFDGTSNFEHKKTTDSSIYLEVNGLSPLQSNQPESTLEREASSLDLDIVHPHRDRISDDVVMDDVLRDIRHLQQTAQCLEILECDDYVETQQPYYRHRETDSQRKTASGEPMSLRSDSTDTSCSDGDNEETDTHDLCHIHRDTLETKTPDDDGEDDHENANGGDDDDSYHNRVLDNPFRPEQPSYSNSIVRFVVQKSIQQQQQVQRNPFRAKHPYISDTHSESNSLMKLVNATPANPTALELPHPPKRRQRDMTESPVRKHHSNLHNQLSRTHPNTVRNANSTASTMSDETYNFVENLQVLHEHDLAINQVNSTANIDPVIEYMEVKHDEKLGNKQELSMQTHVAESYTYTHQPSRNYQYYEESISEHEDM